MLSRTIRFLCSESLPRTVQLLRRYQLAEENLKISTDKLGQVNKQMKEENEKLQMRNKQVHQMRVQLTNDVKKGEQIWSSTKKKVEGYKKQEIQNFARGLVELGQNLSEIKILEREDHDANLKEGFDLTSRLFFNTLEKYNIIKYQPEKGTPLDKKLMQVDGEEKSEVKEDKGKIAEVLETGWEADGTIIKKAKVLVYI